MAEVTTIGNIATEKSILDGTEYFPVDDAGILKKVLISALTSTVNETLAEAKNLTFYFEGMK